MFEQKNIKDLLTQKQLDFLIEELSLRFKSFRMFYGLLSLVEQGIMVVPNYVDQNKHPFQRNMVISLGVIENFDSKSIRNGLLEFIHGFKYRVEVVERFDETS